VNAIFLVGCGNGHVRQMTTTRDFASNNTAVLFNDFAVRAFLVLTYIALT